MLQHMIFPLFHDPSLGRNNHGAFRQIRFLLEEISKLLVGIILVDVAPESLVGFHEAWTSVPPAENGEESV